MWRSHEAGAAAEGRQEPDLVEAGAGDIDPPEPEPATIQAAQAATRDNQAENINNTEGVDRYSEKHLSLTFFFYLLNFVN